ncbi:MAG: TPM domain-containing protein [Clostridia bacterium]|nr:TPM domain-containing protein [Clostridia bacterium]
MKRIICMLMACLMLCASAAAAPRFPDKGGAAVDDAAVLSRKTTEEMTKLHDLADDEIDVQIYLVTVDFLDGYTLTQYGTQLMDVWDLGDDALLVLMAVGEDKCAAFAGEDVKLSSSVLQKLVTTTLEPAFLRQSYDEAVQAFMPALVTELNKRYEENIRMDGLFGVQESRPAVDWMERFTRDMEEAYQSRADRYEAYEAPEENDDGVSLGKIILTFIFLSMIFSKKGKGKRGCGCMPFAGLFGLWKLWDRN